MRIADPFIQTRLDRPSILDLDLNLESRHEMVPLLRGLQELYQCETSRNQILQLVERDVLKGVSSRRGRRGLDYWTITVLAAARLALNLDYDALQDFAENHRNLRFALGFGEWEQDRRLDWRRIRQSVCRLQPETLDRISAVIVSLGHQRVPEAAKTARVDTFVMGTNVHFPTDIRQTGDALRCLVRHGHRLGDIIESTTLRQHKHLQRRIKSLILVASRASASKGRGREARLETAVRDLVHFAHERCNQVLELLDELQLVLPHLDDFTRAQAVVEQQNVVWFLSALAQVADVAQRRLVNGEDVPLSDRLFSVFEAHTELIVRGKVPVPVEFGHRVLIAEDGAGFILMGRVLANGRQDREVTSTVARLIKRQCPDIESISFDRGFHSPANQERLGQIVPEPCLPTPGVHAAAAQLETVSEAWHAARRRHPGIEAAIGTLQASHGCARCRDKGKLGYRRYLALAILAKNLLTLGRIAIAEETPKVLAGRSRRKVA